MEASATRRSDGLPAGLTGVILVADRPPRPSALSQASTFAWRALLKIKHVPEQLFDVLITPVMFTVMFTYLFGGALAGSPREYLHFLLPGILAQVVIFTSIYTGVTLNTDLSRGIYDRFKSMPLWRPSPIVGAMLGDVLRYTTGALVVIAIGMVMGYRPPAGPLSLVLVVILTNAFAFGVGWVFTVLGLVLRSPSAVMTIGWVVLMPFTFASNIFVDPATMPEWLQSVVMLNPVTHLVDAMRSTLAGTVSLAQVAVALSTPVIIGAIFGPLAMVLYRRRR